MGTKSKMVEMDKLKKSIEAEFGQDVFIEADSLGAALNRLFLVNRANLQATQKRDRKIAEKRAALEQELQAGLEAGELDEEDVQARLEDFDADEENEPTYNQVSNLLVMGEPGGGKTAIIEQWAKSHHIQLLVVTASDLGVSITRGLPYAQDRNVSDEETLRQMEARGLGKTVKVQDYLPSTFFDGLDDPDAKYTVLFVDELNRMRSEVEASLLTLVQDHTINNKYEKGGRHKFNKFLFTVAACNPPDSSTEVHRIGLALATRFKLFIWDSNPLEMKKFWDRQFENIIEDSQGSDDPIDEFNLKRATGAKRILDALVDSGQIQFGDKHEAKRVGDQTTKSTAKATDIHVLNARTLATALTSCDGRIGLDPDGGDRYPVGSFMYEFRNSCTRNPKLLQKVADILEGLQDDLNSEGNQFLNTYWGKFVEWKKLNRGKYGISK